MQCFTNIATSIIILNKLHTVWFVLSAYPNFAFLRLIFFLCVIFISIISWISSTYKSKARFHIWPIKLAPDVAPGPRDEYLAVRIKNCCRVLILINCLTRYFKLFEIEHEHALLIFWYLQRHLKGCRYIKWPSKVRPILQRAWHIILFL